MRNQPPSRGPKLESVLMDSRQRRDSMVAVSNDNCTRVPRVDEDFQFADPAVCGNQFEAEPRSCGLTPVDVSLFRRRLGHCSYNKMKTSSG